jgi:hypothetical protein
MSTGPAINAAIPQVTLSFLLSTEILLDEPATATASRTIKPVTRKMMRVAIILRVVLIPPLESKTCIKAA